jgi:hypothetical protein
MLHDACNRSYPAPMLVQHSACAGELGIEPPEPPVPLAPLEQRVAPLRRSSTLPSTVAATPVSESLRLLQRAVERSKRTSGVQLPIGFVRAEPSQTKPPPLAKMIRGGRGGEVRLKLYLSLNLLATRRPYDIRSIPARAWAEMLGLPDPEIHGARRISDALVWLADEHLIALARKPGTPPTITLLNPTGTGAKYVRPGGRWITVPLGLWEQEWITVISGTGIALLLVLLDMQGGKNSPAHAPSLTGAQRLRYQLSDDTWTRASAELTDLGLLTVRRVSQGRDFDWRRMRNTYWVDKAVLDSRAEASPSRSRPG